eukprot:gnl/TRDRNA2_/TRDRNA2_175689_c5_seq4.p1 gnl/TRDRNA2_/TRDRNA2_175689_c5~~gnl/TRDRNA2_/TRDRNA2_175689_c5_seq4.p1  ORF type:complete len:322 (+),score=53.29 gnl/TRDRNA2_/TRDRNA2_175689_c5_seq4:82-1047(+)
MVPDRSRSEDLPMYNYDRVQTRSGDLPNYNPQTVQTRSGDLPNYQTRSGDLPNYQTRSGDLPNYNYDRARAEISQMKARLMQASSSSSQPDGEMCPMIPGRTRSEELPAYQKAAARGGPQVQAAQEHMWSEQQGLPPPPSKLMQGRTRSEDLPAYHQRAPEPYFEVPPGLQHKSQAPAPKMSAQGAPHNGLQGHPAQLGMPPSPKFLKAKNAEEAVGSSGDYHARGMAASSQSMMAAAEPRTDMATSSGASSSHGIADDGTRGMHRAPGQQQQQQRDGPPPNFPMPFGLAPPGVDLPPSQQDRGPRGPERRHNDNGSIGPR